MHCVKGGPAHLGCFVRIVGEVQQHGGILHYVELPARYACDQQPLQPVHRSLQPTAGHVSPTIQRHSSGKATWPSSLQCTLSHGMAQGFSQCVEQRLVSDAVYKAADRSSSSSPYRARAGTCSCCGLYVAKRSPSCCHSAADQRVATVAQMSPSNCWWSGSSSQGRSSRTDIACAALCWPADLPCVL